MSTTGQSITLANSIIGVGILAMPFCFQQCGVILASLILLFMGLVSRLCCYFLLKSAFLARRRNFEFLAFHVFGSAGKLAVELGIIGFLMGTCIAYFVVMGDLGPQIISKMFNINQSDILRTSIMVIVSLVCVLPLGLLRNVDSLSNVSAATIGFYFCLVIKVIAEAASQLPSGDWHRRMELWKPSGVLQCVPIFSMALFCQTQLFEIFESLPSLSLEKMNLVTKNAINICSGVYLTLGVFGYIAFSSQQISGNILMSLSPTMASDVIKLGFVMSLAFSFPLIIFPCRASLYSFLYKKVHSSHHDHIINHSIPETTFRCITVGIIAVALFISLLIPNIELVLGLVGSTIGVLICIVFPAACFINITFKNTNERVLAKVILVLGLVIMVLGTYANLQAAENQIDRYDDRFITQDKIDKIVEDFFEKRGQGEDHLNLKPVPKKDPIADTSKINSNIKKDSEIQPPNPVPPESNSNELKSPVDIDKVQNEKLNIEKKNNDKLVNDVLLPEKLKEAEAADTASDFHPKNLKSKLDDAKAANGNIKKTEEKPPVIEENKIEKIKLIKQQKLIETMKQHGEEQKELLQQQKEILDEIIKNKKEIILPKEAKLPDDPKADVNKHEKLIETIKQHGEEQKELMKEQKEILDEIKELKQNKDTDNEAKKLAVESIKQIADMAIKSIGGVTDKPAGQPKEDKKSERLEKLTNEAVQEIAKKAVETIEAIQEIKEKPDPVKPIDTSNNILLDKPAIPNIVDSKLDVQVPAQNINPLQQNQNENIAMPNVKRDVLNKVPESNVNMELMKEEPKIASPISNNEAVNQIVETKKAVPLAKDPITNLNDIEVKPHSHSPDEPQSYIVGEDLQIKNVDKKVDQNVPIAVAMSDQAKLDKNGIKEVSMQPRNENNVNSKQSIVDADKIISKLNTVIRQKRDVVDCTQTISLDPVRRKICEVTSVEDNSINTVPKIDKIPIVILPKVDLNDGLSRFPLNPNLLHIGRSLKSYDENEKR